MRALVGSARGTSAWSVGWSWGWPGALQAQGWGCWGWGGCSIVRQVDIWFYLWSQGDIFSCACLWSLFLSVEIPVFLPVPFLPGAHTSLPAAPGSLRAQEPPGGPAAAGAVPAAPAQRPAPVPAARLRGRSLLGAAVPVLLCLSVQMLPPCQCSLCFTAPPFPSPHPAWPHQPPVPSLLLCPSPSQPCAVHHAPVLECSVCPD